MAQEMEISKEDVIDKILDVAQADGLMGVIGAHLAAEALALATVRWRKENGIEEWTLILNNVLENSAYVWAEFFCVKARKNRDCPSRRDNLIEIK